MYESRSHWTDFCEIWQWRLLWKSVEKIPKFVKFEQKIGYLAWNPKRVSYYWQRHMYVSLAAFEATELNETINRAHCCISMATLLKFTLFRATHLRKQHRASTLLRFHGNSDYASTPMLPYKYTAYITTFKCTEFSTFPNSLQRSTFMFDILKNTWFSNLRRHTGYLNSVSC